MVPLNMSLTMEGGDEVEKLAGTLVEFYNKRGFGEASSWAEKIENPKLKEAAFTKLSRSLARDKPEQMASWLETACRTRNTRLRLLKT